MLTVTKAKRIAQDSGFAIVLPLAAETLQFRQDIRALCTPGACPTGYGKSWSCPPAVPPVAHYAQLAACYTQGIAVQTVGELEDEFDYDSILSASLRHKAAFVLLANSLAGEAEEAGGTALCLGAGACSRCKHCTYPEAPCRYPSRTLVSMEASGLYVTQVCEDNGLTYNHGKNTITYTSCCLF